MQSHSAERRLTIVFDLDSIIVDLLNPWINWYNKEFDDSLQVRDLHSWHIHQHVKPECGERIYEFFRDNERYASSPILDGATEGLAKLHELGHRVVISTATGVKAKTARTAQAKLALINKAAPFIDNIHIGPDKFIICGDVFVDDSPENLRIYKDRWPEAKLVTIAYPYNRDIMNFVDVYAQGFDRPRQAWDEIVTFITAQQEISSGR